MSKDITQSSFEIEVLKNTKPVVVDFWAEWCGPCKFLEPVLRELENQYDDKISFVKVNVDNEPALSQQYRIMSIPTVLYFKDGKVVDSTTGALPKNELEEHLKKLL